MNKRKLSDHEIQTISSMPESKALYSAIHKEHKAEIDQAASLIKKGSFDEAMRLLEPALKAPETQKLLQQIGNRLG